MKTAWLSEQKQHAWQRLMPQACALGAAYLIHRLIQMAGDMEPIQHVQSLAGLDGDDLHQHKGEAVGFLTGFRHPISGLDHVLAMLAVGLWGAQLGAPAIWILPVAFPTVMAMGGMLGLMGVPLPGIEYGIALSAVLLGAAVMFEMRPPIAVAAALIGFFALFHGHAHGTELPPGQSALLYSIGFVIATGSLHALGIGIGTLYRWDWGKKLLRVAGGLVAGAGIVFLSRALV